MSWRGPEYEKCSQTKAHVSRADPFGHARGEEEGPTSFSLAVQARTVRVGSMVSDDVYLWSGFPRDEVSSIRWRGAVRYGSLLHIVCERIRPQSTAKRGFFLLL